MKFLILKISSCFFLLVAIYFGFAFLFNHYFIRINLTNSVPYTLFFTTKKEQPEKGDYVTFYHKNYPKKLVKKVIGIEGDTVKIEGSQMSVCGEIVGDMIEVSQTGYRPSPLREKAIPEGYFFVKGDHLQSFDSRYEEFGLLKKENVLEVLWPIF